MVGGVPVVNGQKHYEGSGGPEGLTGKTPVNHTRNGQIRPELAVSLSDFFTPTRRKESSARKGRKSEWEGKGKGDNFPRFCGRRVHIG